jgi:hypothetical protein
MPIESTHLEINGKAILSDFEKILPGRPRCYFRVYLYTGLIFGIIIAV